MRPVPALALGARAPRPWLGIGLGLLAAAAMAPSLHELTQLQQGREQLEQQRLALRRGPVQRRAPVTEADQLALALAQSVQVQLHTPWFALLAAFEGHAHKDIGLLRLEPDARAMQVRVSAQARDLAAMLGYLRALEQDPLLSDVMLLSHHVDPDVPGRPVRFSIRAGWRREASVASTPTVGGSATP